MPPLSERRQGIPGARPAAGRLTGSGDARSCDRRAKYPPSAHESAHLRRTVPRQSSQQARAAHRASAGRHRPRDGRGDLRLRSPFAPRTRPGHNPDYVSIVIHNYRWRLSLAEGDPQYDDLEKRLAEGPVIAVPTITLDGDSDGVAPASDGTSYAKKFSGKRTHRIIKGIGHNLPQEAPQAFAEAVVEVER